MRYSKNLYLYPREISHLLLIYSFVVARTLAAKVVAEKNVAALAVTKGSVVPTRVIVAQKRRAAKIRSVQAVKLIPRIPTLAEMLLNATRSPWKKPNSKFR